MNYPNIYTYKWEEWIEYLNNLNMIPTAEEFWNKQPPMKNIPDSHIEFAMICLDRAKDLDIQTVYNQLKQQLPKK